MTNFNDLLTTLSNLPSVPVDALEQLRDCLAKNFPSLDLDTEVD